MKMTVSELSVFLPNSIKLEIIKEKLIELYKREDEYKKIINRNKEYLDTTSDYYEINKYKNILISDYKELIELLKKFNLPDEIITKLYIWAKQERTSSGLDDNIYNVFDDGILFKDKYKELNEKINSKQILR